MDPRCVFGHNLKSTGVESIITKKIREWLQNLTPVSKHPTVQQKSQSCSIQQKMAVKPD